MIPFSFFSFCDQPNGFEIWRTKQKRRKRSETKKILLFDFAEKQKKKIEYERHLCKRFADPISVVSIHLLVDFVEFIARRECTQFTTTTATNCFWTIYLIAIHSKSTCRSISTKNSVANWKKMATELLSESDRRQRPSIAVESYRYSICLNAANSCDEDFRDVFLSRFFYLCDWCQLHSTG